MNSKIYISLIFLFFTFSSCNNQNMQEESTLKKLAEDYNQAYNNHDLQTLTKMFAENGQYVRPEAGIQIQGKDELVKFFNSKFNDLKDAKIDLDINNVKFVNNNEATLTGKFHVIQAGKEIDQRAFKIFYEKMNGQWLITEIRDIDVAEVPDQYEHLKEMEWMIGSFVDQDEDVEITFVNKWDISKNLILGNFSVKMEGQRDLDGTHIIAWDPIKGKIRSWFFDSDGSFGESIWNKKDNSYVADTVQTLADGRRGSSVNIYTAIDSNGYTWESINREIGGELLPDIDPVKIIRK